MTCNRAVFSEHAYLSIVAETYAHIHTETGGILLGTRQRDTWYVLDVIDPGYRQVSRTPGYFEYDTEYVNHLANVRARLYASKIELLGLWHRHPGSFDRFSSTDDQTHQLYIQQNPHGAVSILVNVDPDIRLTVYYVFPSHQRSGFTSAVSAVDHQRLTNWVVGDTHIPEVLRHFPSIDVLIPKPQQHIATRARSGIWDSAKKIWNEFTASTPEHPFVADVETRQEPPMHENEEQTLVLDMLEQELAASLEQQSEYEYQILMDGVTVDIVLQYRGAIPHYPHQIRCQLFVRGQIRLCRLDTDGEQVYEPGMIRRYINKRVEYTMQRSNQRTQPQSSDAAQPISSQTYSSNSPQLSYIDSCRNTFQLPLNFTYAQLKDAYRKKLKEYHPDTWQHENNPTLSENANRATQRIQKMYQALKEYLDDQLAVHEE